MTLTNIATKTCKKCRKDKPFDEFPFKNRSLNIRHSRCNTCMAEASSDWYAKNQKARTAQIAEQRKGRREEARVFIVDYLSSHPCVDCGESDIVVLDFDHVRGDKVMSVSQMVQRGYPLEAILRETSKCDVRCANCHRIQTARRRSY